MNRFLELSHEDRLSAFMEVNRSMGLDAFSVEKDFWVCWTLCKLFTLPGIGEHLTFKGGTSLSKAWKLIHRFSEDIDLIVDKDVLGFGGKTPPIARRFVDGSTALGEGVARYIAWVRARGSLR